MKNRSNVLLDGTHLLAQVVVLTFVVFSTFGKGELKIYQGLLMWILASVTLAYLMQFFHLIQGENQPGFESFWGGIDGGMGGWRISRATSHLIIIFVFGTLFFIVTNGYFQSQEEEKLRNDENLKTIEKLEHKRDSLIKVIDGLKGEANPKDTSAGN